MERTPQRRVTAVARLPVITLMVDGIFLLFHRVSTEVDQLVFVEKTPLCRVTAVARLPVITPVCLPEN